MGTEHKKANVIPEQNELFRRATRAGEVVQVMFYSVIEKTWAYDISNVRIVWDQNDELDKVELIAGPGNDAGPESESACGRHAGGWLFKFPHMAFSGGDLQAVQAVFADQNSIWAFVCMHALVKALFKDLVEDVKKDIKEVVHYTPDNARRLVQRRLVRHNGQFGRMSTVSQGNVYPDYDEKGNVKGVYQITLKDGTKIGLDLAGAQYSLPHDTVMYWSAYLDRWGNAIKYRVPFRSHHHKHMEKMSNYRCITHLTIIMEQLGNFNIFITNCEEKLDRDLKDILTKGNDDYHISKKLLIMRAHYFLHKRIQELDDGTAPRDINTTFDLRHPDVVANLPAPPPRAIDDPGAPLLLDMDVKSFDWNKLCALIRMPTVKYEEKKKARLLLTHRCMYKVPGTWRIMILQETPLSRYALGEYVSENPFKGRR